MDKQKKSFILNVLRRGSYRWYGRYTAEKRSHLPETKRYFCESCGEVLRKKDTHMDHIEPVIPLDRNADDVSIDEIADRLYCKPEGFQRLCKPCHSEKSAIENAQRPAGDRAKGKRKKK